MKRLLICLLLVAVVGCGESDQAQEKPSSETTQNKQPQSGKSDQVQKQPTGETEQATKQPPTEEAGNPWDTPTRLTLFMAQRIEGTSRWGGVSNKALALSRITSALVEAGEIKQALEVAQQVEDPRRKEYVLSDIATRALLKAGDKPQALAILKQALEVAQKIEDSSSKGRTLSTIAAALAKAGEIKQALEIAQQIEDSSSKGRTLSGIASALHEAGDKPQALAILKQALEVAQKIEDPRRKGFALKDIARALVEAGEIKQALEIAQQIENPGSKASTLSYIARVLHEAGEIKQALEVAQQLEDPWSKARTLSGIASALHEAGDKPQALAILKQALEVAQKIEDPRNKESALEDIASTLAKAGEINQALEIAQQIEDSSSKERTLSRIASALHEAGDKPQALAILKQALEVAQKIEDPRTKGFALKDIARALVEAGEIKQALEIAQQIENPGSKAFTLSDIASALHKAGKFNQALEVAQKIESWRIKTYALINIASALHEAGEKPQALATLKQAVEVIRQTDDLIVSTTDALKDIAMSLATRTSTSATPGRRGSSPRMKQSFTPAEKQLARHLVELVQEKTQQQPNGESEQEAQPSNENIPQPSTPVAKIPDAATVKKNMIPAQLTLSDPVVNSVGMLLVPIPEGTFMMGSPENEKDRKEIEHQHKVTITKAFYMQTTEVTQGQWTSVMGTEPWKGKLRIKEGPDYAATYVNWSDAIAYCKRLSAKEGKTYRLPTEAEWEYACRAGTETRWSFGNDKNKLGDYAWIFSNTQDIDEKYAHQVGLKKPNAFGLYDMHGNVYEWCHDYYGEDYYTQSPEKDPTGPASGDLRVARGGSWNLYHSHLTRSAFRQALRIAGLGDRNFYFGFRLVRELD